MASISSLSGSLTLTILVIVILAATQQSTAQQQYLVASFEEDHVAAASVATPKQSRSAARADGWGYYSGANDFHLEFSSRSTCVDLPAFTALGGLSPCVFKDSSTNTGVSLAPAPSAEPIVNYTLQQKFADGLRIVLKYKAGPQASLGAVISVWELHEGDSQPQQVNFATIERSERTWTRIMPGTGLLSFAVSVRVLDDSVGLYDTPISMDLYANCSTPCLQPWCLASVRTMCNGGNTDGTPAPQAPEESSDSNGFLIIVGLIIALGVCAMITVAVVALRKKKKPASLDANDDDGDGAPTAVGPGTAPSSRSAEPDSPPRRRPERAPQQANRAQNGVAQPPRQGDPNRAAPPTSQPRAPTNGHHAENGSAAAVANIPTGASMTSSIPVAPPIESAVRPKPSPSKPQHVAVVPSSIPSADANGNADEVEMQPVDAPHNEREATSEPRGGKSSSGTGESVEVAYSDSTSPAPRPQPSSTDSGTLVPMREQPNSISSTTVVDGSEGVEASLQSVITSVNPSAISAGSIPPSHDENRDSAHSAINGSDAHAVVDSQNTNANRALAADEGSAVAATSEDATAGDTLDQRSNRTSVATPIGSQTGIRFIKGKMLARGGFGRVYEAIDQNSGRLIAAKELTFGEMNPQQVASQLPALQREIVTMKRMEHSNIVSYLGAEKDGTTFYVLMEYVPGGSLRRVLDQYGPMSLQVARKLTRQIVSGLAYVHSQGVVHRDMKAANVLMTTDGNAKIADFGASRRLSTISGMSGTPFWMAPEVIRNEPSSGPSDIWSLGCTVIEILTGNLPLDHLKLSNAAALYIVASGNKGPILPPDGLDPTARDFIVACLAREPQRRPTAVALLEHPFLTQEATESSQRTDASPVDQSQLSQEEQSRDRPMDWSDAAASNQQSLENHGGPLVSIAEDKRDEQHSANSVGSEFSQS